MNFRHLLGLFVCAFCFTGKTVAQFSGHYNALNITGTSNILKTEIPLGPPATVGSNFLNDKWEQGEIFLRDGRSVGSYPLRVEIEHGIIELMLENKPYTLNITNVNHILMLDPAVGIPGKLKNARLLTYDDKALKGVMIVHDIGGSTTKIINNYYIELQPANYNVALDVGSKVNQKIIKQKLFVQKGDELKEIKGSNKRITGLLGYNKVKARETIRTNNLDLSDPKDLASFLKIMG